MQSDLRASAQRISRAGQSEVYGSGPNQYSALAFANRPPVPGILSPYCPALRRSQVWSVIPSIRNCALRTFIVGCVEVRLGTLCIEES